MIRAARELGLLTTPYVFDPSEAVAMADAGADILVAHMGLTTKGAIGARTAPSLDECVERVQAIRDAAPAAELVLCHGGPIAEPGRRALSAGAHARRGGLLRRLGGRAPAGGDGHFPDRQRLQNDHR